MFQIKNIPYGLRDSNILFQPQLSTITYSLKNTFKYYGAHICILVPNDITTIDNLKLLLKALEGPKCENWWMTQQL